VRAVPTDTRDARDLEPPATRRLARLYAARARETWLLRARRHLIRPVPRGDPELRASSTKKFY